MSGQFGPQEPIVPWAIDPAGPSGRPGARRYQYDVSWDMPHYPGAGKLVGFAELKDISERYSVVRAAINIRVRELCGLAWDIVPAQHAHDSIRRSKTALDDFNSRKLEVIQFFKRPDPEYDSYQSWLAAGLDDLFVYDAWALNIWPTRVPGKGPLGSNLGALALLDGTTIYPLVDIKGNTPRPPAPAYQQYIHGAPRVDLMTLIEDEDQARLQALGEADGDVYMADQLIYGRYYRRPGTKYGFSPIEQAITPIKAGIKMQEFQLDFFTEGSIPGLMIICPEQYSPTQVRQLQDALNLAAGDVSQKWKIRCLPGGQGVKVEQLRPADMQERASQNLIEQVLMILDVKPTEVGLLPGGRTSGMGGAALHEQSHQSTKRTATKPMAEWIAGQHSHIIQSLMGQDDMEFRYVGLDDKDDDKSKAETDQIYTSIGGFTLNDLRKNLDMEPYSMAEADEPIIITQTGIQTLTQALAAGDADVQSKQLGIQSQQQLLAHPELRVQGPPGAKNGPAAKPGAPPAGNGDNKAHGSNQKPGSASPKAQLGKAAEHDQHDDSALEPEDSDAAIQAWEQAQLAELAAYRRFRQKSHSRPFEFAHLAKSVAADDVEIVEVEWAIKATAKKRRYVQDSVKRVGAQIQDHVDDLLSGDIDSGTFVDRSHQVMHRAFARAYRSGAQSVSSGYQLSEADRKHIEQQANAQRPYLDNFARAALSDQDKDWAYRSRMYGSAVSSVWEQGRAAGKLEAYGEAYTDGEIEVWVTWHARVSACEQCAAMDGESYPLEDAVEWPGQVHPHCQCYFTYRKVRVPKDRPVQEPDDIVAAATPDLAKGEFELPRDHRPGLRVPEGGSCCANCRWYRGDRTCGNEYFVEWHGSASIPAPADEYCSDWWEPEAAKAA